ncbi:MAG: GNAT family N-acetyltransferase [Candidatus Angelobacter sp.]
MKVIHSTQNVDWPEVAALFVEVNWGQRDPQQIRAAFDKSSHVIFIYDQDQLVAFGRTMDDGCYYAMLVDVVVKPSCQGKGIGRTVVDYLREQLVGYKFVTLTAAPGKDEFYLKLGWYRQKSAMIWPISDAQLEGHVRFP